MDKLESLGIKVCWEHKEWKMFWVIQEVYRQQLAMHRNGEQRIDHRIVSVFQPYVRPIKRGKNGKDTEFGSKLHMMEVDGFVMLEYVDYENYNEANRLKSSVEHYRRVFGYYPSCLLIDRIYLNRENRAWLKEKGIAHYGVPLAYLRQALIFSFFRFLMGESSLYRPIKALVLRLKGRFAKLAFEDFSYRQLTFSYRSLILPRFTG